MMIKRILLIILLVSLPCFGAAHSNKEVPSSERNLYPKQQGFQVVGETTFSVLFWDIYQSKLLTTTGEYPLDYQYGTLLYEIHYLKDISKKDLLKRTIEQWQHLGVPEKSYNPYIPLLTNIWPSIKRGDSLSLVVNHMGSTFYFNQQFIGTIDAPEFGPLFLDIWLSVNTSQPKLRSQLLGEYTP